MTWLTICGRHRSFRANDTSCISNLLTINHAHLLLELFGEVIVPPAVGDELKRFHHSLPVFLKLVAPRDDGLLLRLSKELDRGEAEAICVARQLNADRLLIDEKAGRGAALREGLAIIGVVGVLVVAKQRGIIPKVSVLLDQMEKKAGFRLSPKVKSEALRAVGEHEV